MRGRINVTEDEEEEEEEEEEYHLEVFPTTPLNDIMVGGGGFDDLLGGGGGGVSHHGGAFRLPDSMVLPSGIEAQQLSARSRQVLHQFLELSLEERIELRQLLSNLVYFDNSFFNDSPSHNPHHHHHPSLHYDHPHAHYSNSNEGIFFNDFANNNSSSSNSNNNAANIGGINNANTGGYGEGSFVYDYNVGLITATPPPSSIPVATTTSSSSSAATMAYEPPPYTPYSFTAPPSMDVLFLPQQQQQQQQLQAPAAHHHVMTTFKQEHIKPQQQQQPQPQIKQQPQSQSHQQHQPSLQIHFDPLSPFNPQSQVVASHSHEDEDDTIDGDHYIYSPGTVHEADLYFRHPEKDLLSADAHQLQMNVSRIPNVETRPFKIEFDVPNSMIDLWTNKLSVEFRIGHKVVWCCNKSGCDERGTRKVQWRPPSKRLLLASATVPQVRNRNTHSAMTTTMSAKVLIYHQCCIRNMKEDVNEHFYLRLRADNYVSGWCNFHFRPGRHLSARTQTQLKQMLPENDVVGYAQEHFRELPKNIIPDKAVVITIVDEKDHGTIIESVLKTTVNHLQLNSQLTVKLEVINQNASLEDSYIDEIEDSILFAAENVDRSKLNILVIPFLIEQDFGDIVTDAVRYAQHMGMLVLCPAGNSGQMITKESKCFPANMSSVVTCCALDQLELPYRSSFPQQCKRFHPGKRRPTFVWIPSQIGNSKDNVATSISTLFGALRCALIYLETEHAISHANIVASLQQFYARSFDSVYMVHKYQQQIETLSTTLRAAKLDLEQQRKKTEVQEKEHNTLSAALLAQIEELTTKNQQLQKHSQTAVTRGISKEISAGKPISVSAPLEWTPQLAHTSSSQSSTSSQDEEPADKDAEKSKRPKTGDKAADQ